MNSDSKKCKAGYKRDYMKVFDAVERECEPSVFLSWHSEKHEPKEFLRPMMCVLETEDDMDVGGTLSGEYVLKKNSPIVNPTDEPDVYKEFVVPMPSSPFGVGLTEISKELGLEDFGSHFGVGKRYGADK